MNRRQPLVIVAVTTSLFATPLSAEEPSSPARSPTGITAVEGVQAGHHTLSERPTGCTVLLFEHGAVGGVDVRGSAPGTRETDLLDPINSVQRVHGLVLAGGSAFGLDSASGAMRYLEEKGIGFDVGIAKVPIVPAAILFDLGVGGRPDIRPGADCGYRAAAAATSAPLAEGSVGAGAGATVGKLGGPGRSMKGGIGTSAITLENGLVVAALIAVNAIGDVIDPATGQVVAGVRTGGESDSMFADARLIVRSGALDTPAPAPSNTTIGVIATNAVLTKVQAKKIAQMAHDGLARSIYPAHTPWDGDTLFAVGTGTYKGPVNIMTIGALAADVAAEAVLRSVREATGTIEFPAVRDLKSAADQE